MPREVGDSSSLELSKNHVGVVPEDVVWWWTPWWWWLVALLDLGGVFQPQQFREVIGLILVPLPRPSPGIPLALLGWGCEATNVSWFPGPSFLLGRFYRATFLFGTWKVELPSQQISLDKQNNSKASTPPPQSKALPKDPFQTPKLEIFHFLCAVPSEAPPSSAILPGSSQWRLRDGFCPQKWQLWPAGSSDMISRWFPKDLFFPIIPVSTRAIGLRS